MRVLMILGFLGVVACGSQPGRYEVVLKTESEGNPAQVTAKATEAPVTEIQKDSAKTEVSKGSKVETVEVEPTAAPAVAPKPDWKDWRAAKARANLGPNDPIYCVWFEPTSPDWETLLHVSASDIYVPKEYAKLAGCTWWVDLTHYGMGENLTLRYDNFPYNADGEPMNWESGFLTASGIVSTFKTFEEAFGPQKTE